MSKVTKRNTLDSKDRARVQLWLTDPENRKKVDGKTYAQGGDIIKSALSLPFPPAATALRAIYEVLGISNGIGKTGERKKVNPNQLAEFVGCLAESFFRIVDELDDSESGGGSYFSSETHADYLALKELSRELFGFPEAEE